MRIKGLVRAAHQVRSQLNIGVPAQEAAHFKAYVQQTVRTVEQLCREAQMTPAQLPKPSQSAYAYLKTLNLNRLPIAADDQAASSARTLSIKNIRVEQRQIQAAMGHLAQHPTPDPAEVANVTAMLQTVVARIEALCAKANLGPDALAGFAKPIYGWMKFLLEADHLANHIWAVHRTRQFVLDTAARLQNLPPLCAQSLVVEFEHGASLYRFQHGPKGGILRASEGYIAASDVELSALAHLFVVGPDAAKAKCLKMFAADESFREVLMAIDLMADDGAEQSQGSTYDLETIFNCVNETYFGGALSKPRLSWSRAFTHRKFGHYEPSRDRIVLSRTLDNPQVPSYVLEFVMYHELLHKQQGATWTKERRMVHTPEFRQQECQFKAYQQAHAFLNQLASP
ncbi:MAG TPA: hypothetical protein V6D19_21815 [Stenomitos sp.]